MNPDPAKWRVIAHADDCYDGKCPTIWVNEETGAVRLRGYAPGDRARELDVEYTAAEWARMVGQLPK